MSLGQNIAKNAALRENVFMIAICIELRIPLFLVGKPGSSKSLAKSIVQMSMQGAGSSSELLRGFKQVNNTDGAQLASEPRRVRNGQRILSLEGCTSCCNFTISFFPTSFPSPFSFPLPSPPLSSPTGAHFLLPMQPALHPRECDRSLQHS